MFFFMILNVRYYLFGALYVRGGFSPMDPAGQFEPRILFEDENSPKWLVVQ